MEISISISTEKMQNRTPSLRLCIFVNSTVKANELCKVKNFSDKGQGNASSLYIFVNMLNKCLTIQNKLQKPVYIALKYITSIAIVQITSTILSTSHCVNEPAKPSRSKTSVGKQSVHLVITQVPYSPPTAAHLIYE